MQRVLQYSLLFVFFQISLRTAAQVYSNEWINFSQKYYKIKVLNDGIYRVDSAALASAGIKVGAGGINPKNIQVFNKGVQQYLYIQGEGDGVFNSADYLEFYGKHNDGKYDSTLYFNINFLPNPYYSLFNDTAIYFLTLNNATNNFRMTPVKSTNYLGAQNVPSPYFMFNSFVAPSISYYGGATTSSGSGVTVPQYTAAEGFFDVPISIPGTVSYSLSTKYAYLSGPAPTGTMIYVGASQDGSCNYPNGIGCPSNGDPTPGDHYLQYGYTGSSGYQKFNDTIFYGYAAIRKTFSFTNPGQLGSTSTSFAFSTVASGPLGTVTAFGSPGSMGVSYISLTYPHAYNLENAYSFMMGVPPPSPLGDTTLLSMTGFSMVGGDSIRLYDLSNHFRVPVSILSKGTIFDALLPYRNAAIRQCYVAGDAQVNHVTGLIPVGPYGTSTPGQFTDFLGTYGTLDSAYLIVTHPSLWSAVAGTNKNNTYQGYRGTTKVGFDAPKKQSRVIAADINELYDQFAYGIVKDPLSIRNFAHFTLDKFHTPPQFLFLVGKSIHPMNCRGYGGGGNYNDCLVPTMGEPPCDNLFTTYLDKYKLEPAIATGRLSAKTANDVSAYLAKIQQFESQPNAAWMKNVLHFAGGSDAGEDQQFLGYLNNWKSIIQAPLWGANVYTFSKTSSAPISINTSDSLQGLINGGVSLMTFFGHSSGQSWDEGVANPNTYNNVGKYPFIMSDGCYAGDIHNDYSSLALSTNSELFVLTPQLGSIGFLASVSLAQDYVLNSYSAVMYKNISKALYSHPIGKCLQSGLAVLQADTADILSKCGFLFMTLEGDPSVVLNSPLKPDYAVSSSDIVFNTVSSQSYFYVTVTEHNIAEYVDSLYTIQLTRTYPNNQTKTYLRAKYAPANQDTVVFAIPYNPSLDPGLNTFTVTLNSLKQIPELNNDYANNTVSASLDMLGNSIIPVYPYNYAIVPSTKVRLEASTINAFYQKLVRYKFQMDTTDKYNSPVLDTTSVLSKGGVVEWTPTRMITNKDSIVYFWRVCADTNNWREFSFQVIKGKRGWGEAQFFQFKNDGFQYVFYNKPARRFDFVNNQVSIQVQTGLYTYLSNIPTFFGYPQYSINGNQEEDWFCNYATYSFAIINPFTGQPWSHAYTNTVNGEERGPYNSLYCPYAGQPASTTTPTNAFEYQGATTSHPAALMKGLMDNVPKGYYVLCYTQNYHPLYSNIPGDSVYATFDEIGANLRPVQYSPRDHPLIVWGQKGGKPGSARIIAGAQETSLIQLDTSITTNWYTGYVVSPVIGPALTWDSLYWRVKYLVPANTDSIRLGIIGIKNDGTIDTLIGSIHKNGLSRDSIQISLKHYVNPAIYPFIQLIVYMSSTNVHPTPPQLKRWQVIYTPVPELAINELAANYYIKKDTVSEGDTIKFAYPIQNISEFNFASNLILSSWIQDSKGIPHNLPDRYLNKPLPAGKLVMDTVKVSTLGYPNLNSLWVEVNELGKPRTQPEQYHFNNIASINFNVNPDKTNPLLDVTFDGIHILNLDIVSARPNILIKLMDENKFLALNDPSDFAVFIQSPTAAVATLIPFGPLLSFTPAVLPNNSCLLNYTPIFVQDGIYTLIVQAKDRSGNISGAPYTIQFQIITESTITQVMNYPNPFSTITRFVFTLTGSQVPDYFKIQIITITGKVVKELNKEELGPIHIGRNITEYGWDGRDQYGNLVGNGLYLYHVQTQLNGNSIANLTSGADAYMTSGFGKMYLIR
jgi:hypothetical protein